MTSDNPIRDRDKQALRRDVASGWSSVSVAAQRGVPCELLPLDRWNAYLHFSRRCLGIDGHNIRSAMIRNIAARRVFLGLTRGTVLARCGRTRGAEQGNRHRDYGSHYHSPLGTWSEVSSCRILRILANGVNPLGILFTHVRSVFAKDTIPHRAPDPRLALRLLRRSPPTVPRQSGAQTVPFAQAANVELRQPMTAPPSP